MGLDGFPEARTLDLERPTRTVAIWCCTCALLTMLLRLFGKLVRINKWEGDDRYMAASIAPLAAWMALTCYILKLGTNNVDYTGLTEEDIQNRELGSKLTFAARFVYIIFIWTQKVSIQSFYRRMISSFWEEWHKKALDWICVILGVTFVATCLGLFGECVPIQQNWQVIPAPPVVCRQAIPYLVMEVAFSSMLDVLLAIYTYPIILGSAMTWYRKSYLLGVFSLNLLPPMVSLAKIPALQFTSGSPQRRVLLAAIHILLQCSVANAVVLMSFTRGTAPKKKRKYRAISDPEAALPASATMQQTRPPLWAHYDISADNSGKNTPREITDRLVHRDSLSLSPDDTNINVKHPSSNLSLQISYDLPFTPLSPPPPVSPRSTVPPTSSRRQSATNIPPSYISSFMPAPSMSLKPYAYNPEPFDERKVNFFDLGGLTEGSATDGNSRKRDSGEGTNGDSDNGNLTPGRKDRRFSFRKYSS